MVLFADVVGFTPMSEALARAGSFGTEELTGILNGWFGAMADCISRYGGDLVEFAGDAVMALFTNDRRTRRLTVRRAVQCALDMQQAVGRFRDMATRAGTFGLGMKVGLGAGPVVHTVVGDPTIRLQPVLTGEALDRAVAAEQRAHSGEVLVDGGLLEVDLAVRVLEHRGEWHVVGGVHHGVQPVRPTRPGTTVEDVAERLGPFFHPVIAERLRSGRHEFVNEHRRVTSAFVRLPGSAGDGAMAVTSLQQHVAAAVQVIDRYGGHLRQVATGDKGGLLVVFFGAPTSHEDDEERAVRCCLELLRVLGDSSRAAVTSGSVYCGEIGSDLRREYAVIGDSVNLAARLMQIAAPGQLLIDEPSHERLRGIVVQDGLEPVEVKGKAGRIGIWTVHAVHDRPPARPPGLAAGHALVGRSAEVARVRTLVERSLSGEGQVVCLSGDPGIGKSRLAAEIVDMAERLGFAVHGGACRSHGTTTGYLVWRPIWRGLLQVDAALPIAEQQAALVEAITHLDGGSGERAPLLAPVVNLPIPDSDFTADLDHQGREDLLQSLLLRCLRARARTGPVLLMLEDCHWIDAASQTLLEFLGRNVADLPVLVLVTARRTATDPPVMTPILPLAHVTEERLTELAPADAERLVGLRLHQRYGADATIAPDMVQQIAERGEGNPFYLEELVSYLHGRGVELRDPRAFTGLELPDGLQRLVMARIDQLSESENATIKVASVIGRRFPAAWISQIHPSAGGPREVLLHLERLDELDLTPRQPDTAEPEYQFKHAIIQEAAYQSLTFQMREQLHERVGLLIEAACADRLPQYVDLLAHHYGHSKRVDKQRVWFRAAGDSAKAAFANEAASAHYERLLPLLAVDETGDVLVELGAVWHLTGQWAKAEQAYREAMEIAARSGRRDVLAAAQRDLGDLFMFTQSYAEAVSWLTRAAEEFEQLDDHRGLSRALDRLTYALYQQGAYDQALAAAERHLALATDAGDRAGMSVALNHTGLVHMNTGEIPESRALLQQALDTAAEAGDRRCLLHATNNLGLVHWRSGDHLRAVTCWQEAVPVAHEIGDTQTAGIVIGNMGEAYLGQGDLVGAIKCFTHALRIGVALRDWTSIADQVANVAAIAAALGLARAAERLLTHAIALARHLDAPYFLCGWLHQLAKLHLAQGRLDQAERLNSEALDVANEHNERDVTTKAYILSVRLQVALDRMDVEKGVQRLRALERDPIEPHERAMLLDAVWHLTGTEEAARKAADQHRTLHDRAPTVEHREACARLTGVRLPSGPPLPPLPDDVEAEVADFPRLLREVDQAIGQLGAG
ncbi:tetratricopeptide repeat protein [Geodermatophilus sp. URMC 61]|uniref:tetratricopeptide repeat protein n=1 Tax=Geodermatophilus sp. URMC 61 TaxID=3423411 RepID=UPI00406D4C97